MLRRFVFIVSLALLAASCGTDDQADRADDGPGGDDRATSQPEDASTTSDPLSPIPGEFIVSRSPEGVEVRSTETGASVAGVAIGPGGHGGAADITMPGGGGTVYAATEVTSCAADLQRAAVGGAEAERIGRGFSPAVDRNEDRLAYTPTICPTGTPSVVIRELATGSEQAFELQDTPGRADTTTVFPKSWNASGEILAIEVVHQLDGDVPQIEREIRLLDTESDLSLDDATLLRPPRAGSQWRAPAFRGDLGTVAVSATRADGDPDERFSIVEVDPTSGRVLGELTSTDQLPRSLDFDRTGQHLLYVGTHGDRDQRAVGPPTLWRWSAADGSVQLAEDVHQAVW